MSISDLYEDVKRLKEEMAKQDQQIEILTEIVNTHNRSFEMVAAYLRSVEQETV